MIDLLRTAATFLEGQRAANMATTLVYSRGANSISIAATIAKTEEEIVTQDNVGIRSQVRDYIFQRSAMTGSVPFPPLQGDQIIEADGSIWQLMSLGDREGVWRWHDSPNDTAVRVHAKQIGN